jgi:adenine-specific DNA methylase
MMSALVINKKFTEQEIKDLKEAWNNSYPTIITPLEDVQIMIKRIEVKNLSMNSKGKQDITMVQVETLLEASRFINSFKPKRGYQHVSWNIQEVEVLL